MLLPRATDRGSCNSQSNIFSRRVCRNEDLPQPGINRLRTNAIEVNVVSLFCVAGFLLRQTPIRLQREFTPPTVKQHLAAVRTAYGIARRAPGC